MRRNTYVISAAGGAGGLAIVYGVSGGSPGSVIGVTGSSLLHRTMLKLVPTVRTKVSTVVYTWHCFNCGRMLKVSAKKYLKLKRGELNGLQCGTCLRPPDGGAVAAA